MSASDFADHFSATADRYARYRPGYPEALFDELAALCPVRELAWDAGCGNGQATVPLAARFARVIATEPSRKQLAHAPLLSNVEYRCEPAESSSLDAQSVDLAVVAQAMHWFDLPRYFDALARVLKPGGIFASWCYQDFIVDPRIEDLVGDFRAQVRACWPPERALIDAGYAGIAFPFERLIDRSFAQDTRWTCAQLAGYLRSQSAVQAWRETHGCDPVDALEQRLGERMPAGEDLQLRWPLRLHACRKT